MKTFQECIRICREAYPDMTPCAYVEGGGKYLFNLIPKGADPNHSMADFHVVDAESGQISGGISAMDVMKVPELREVWQHAIPVNESDTAEHSGFFEASSVTAGGLGWSIRANSRNDTDELAHYGIKGQKRGVRRFQNEDRTWTEAGKERYYKYKKKNGNSGIQNDGSTGDLTNEEKKKAAIGIAALIAAPIAQFFLQKVVINTIKRVKQNKRTARSRELNDEFIGDIAVHKDFSSENPPKRIQGPHSMEEDMAAINPKYRGRAVAGTTNNCSLCSYTYDLRRRGYDVTAKPSIEGNWNDVLMTDLYKGARKEVISGRDWNDVYKNAAQKYPEGARGVIGVYGYYSGHAMAWEIRNGKLVILDGQRNVKSSPDEMKEYGFHCNKPFLSDMHPPEFIRTDNLELRMENVGFVCSELKPDWKKTVRNEAKDRATKYFDDEMNFDRKSVKKMTTAEKRASLEKIWKQDHEDNVHMDDSAREAMKKWVDANMWSMYGHEGLVLAHGTGWSISARTPTEEELMHYGIKGQKRGVRRFQNEDRTWTEAGKERYSKSSGKSRKDTAEEETKTAKSSGRTGRGTVTGLNREGQPVIVADPKKDEREKWADDDPSQLSDEELNRRNRRLQQERQYYDLTHPKTQESEASREAKNIGRQIFQTVLLTTLLTPLAFVIGKKWKFGLAKVRDFLHNMAGKPLPKPTDPETFFKDEKKKNKDSGNDNE